MESLRALADLFTNLHPLLASAMHAVGGGGGAAGGNALDALYSELFALVPLICAQVYRGAARNLLALDAVLSMVSMHVHGAVPTVRYFDRPSGYLPCMAGAHAFVDAQGAVKPAQRLRLAQQQS